MSSEALRIAAEAALALTVRHLPPPHTVGDARVFSAGRLHLWDGWSRISDSDRLQIGRFLRLRPQGLEEDRTFTKAIEQALLNETRFRRTSDDVRPMDTQFEAVPGKRITDTVEELLAALAQRRGRLPIAARVDEDGFIRLRSGRSSYTVPAAFTSESGSWPAVKAGLSVPGAVIQREQLLSLADQLDGVLGTPYNRKTLESLFQTVRVGELGAQLGSSIDLPSGPTQLFVAPTGSGKSVFARVVALDLALRGVPVALVVPDFKTVLEETHRLEGYLRKLGSDATVVPVNSVRKQFERTASLLQHPPPHDQDGAWMLDRFGYSCSLDAYIDDANAGPAPGEEPCQRLTQDAGGKATLALCPFATECSKFGLYREAAESAQILVVNHHALLMGRAPLPVVVDGRVTARLPVVELVLRRCAVVLIDEIDQLQANAVQQDTGDLQLTSYKNRLSPLHELSEEFDRRLANRDLPDTLRPDRAVRPALVLLRWLCEEFTDALQRRELRWTGRDRMRWSRSRDGEVSRLLFESMELAQERLNAIFDGEQIQGDDFAEELRKVLSNWAACAPGDEDVTIDDLRRQLTPILEQWRKPLKQRSRAKVIDGLVVRAMLARFERALGTLRSYMPLLEQLDIRNASSVRDALLGYAPWSSSPLGPMGRRAMGFSYKRHGQDHGALHVQTLAGDPHGWIAGLGDDVALALAGTRRAVLGVSATARFSGAPTSDVLAPILLAQPDVRFDSVNVHRIMLKDTASETDEPLRVSGISGLRRLEHASRMAALLWDRVLRDHLLTLQRDSDTSQRARALLVTGSYSEARAVGTALVRSMPDQNEARRRIRVITQKKSSSEPFQTMLRSELEAFGSCGADILIAPLAVVARGHNIIQPGTVHSAIASIFVLVRPVPPCDDVQRVLAHLSYDARKRFPATDCPGDSLRKERLRAEGQLRFLHQSAGPFSRLPEDLRHHVLCDVLVDIAQLAGRARRGGTSVNVFLVDAAFHDEHVGWDKLLRDSFGRWAADGTLPVMTRLHGAFLGALRRFAGISEGDDERPASDDVLSADAAIAGGPVRVPGG